MNTPILDSTGRLALCLTVAMLAALPLAVSLQAEDNAPVAAGLLGAEMAEAEPATLPATAPQLHEVQPVLVEPAPYAQPLPYALPVSDVAPDDATPAVGDPGVASEVAQAADAAVEGTLDLFRGSADFREAPELEGSGDAVTSGDDSPQAVPEKGYFPTREEWRTLGGYYARPGGASPENPGGGADGRSTLAVSGLWPYQSETANPNSFYARNDPFFGPVERVFGVLVPDFREGWNYEGRNWSVEVPFAFDLNVPFLTRGFNPERSTLALGPLYFDLLSVSGSLLYSDYSGTIDPQYDNTDGWISVIDVSVRAVIRFSENMFLSIAGTVSFYPEEGNFGFRLGYGNGGGLSIGSLARFVYEHEFNNGWIFQILDTVDVQDFFADVYGLYGLEVDELVTSGRYRFGSDLDRNEQRRGSGDFWDETRLYLTNRFEASFIGPIWPEWNGRFGVGRDDYWTLDDFEHANAHNEIFTEIDYTGERLRFAPYFRYSMVSNGSTDNDWGSFDVWRHTAETGVRGPITETLRLEARAGYSFITGGDEGDPDADTWIYEMGLIHEFGPYTRHSFFAGNVIDYDGFGDERISKYMRYTIDQVLGPRLRARAFIQGADIQEYGNDTRQQLLAGGSLAFNIFDFTRLTGSVIYEDISSDTDEDGDDHERWIYRGSIEHRILPGLFGSATYQFEDYREATGGYFDEHLVILTLTKTF